MKMRKAFSAQLGRDHRFARETGGASLRIYFLDGLGNHVNPLVQHAECRVFASYLN